MLLSDLGPSTSDKEISMVKQLLCKPGERALDFRVGAPPQSRIVRLTQSGWIWAAYSALSLAAAVGFLVTSEGKSYTWGQAFAALWALLAILLAIKAFKTR